MLSAAKYLSQTKNKVLQANFQDLLPRCPVASLPFKTSFPARHAGFGFSREKKMTEQTQF